MLSESFTRALRGSREELNARFAEARQRLPALAADAFSKFLRDAVDPLVRAIDAVRPESAESVALASYEIALELVGQRIAGADGRGTAIDETWRRVLPASARVVAASPARVLASFSNAAHRVESTPGARVAAWIDDMARLGADCASVDELLRVGAVAAWRAGLAHLRSGAITAASLLPESLALAAVGASPSCRWSEIETGLRASEWFDPAWPDAKRPSDPAAAPRKVAMVGAFRGFGGVFLVPPRVTYAAGQFHVQSGDECWLLTADLFGATFHRLAAGEAELPKPVASLPTRVRLPDGPGTITSAASSETTLAVTWSSTHHVMLLALT